MTLLLSWIGVDSQKVSSFYIASDSRFSWRAPDIYDYGQKVFSFNNSPDILGYCGDVLYPVTVINQLIKMNDNGVLFEKTDTNIQRSNKIFDELKKSLQDYPHQTAMRDSLEIIHVSRDNKTDFICTIFKWTRSKGWEKIREELPNYSDKVAILGSGREEFLEKYIEYSVSLGGKTSRVIFQCLCDTLKNIENSECGGAPQLVGLYNHSYGKNFGTIFKDERYFIGRKVQDNSNIENIEWRNELFERCDGHTMKRIKGAQRQPNEFN